MKLSFHLKKNIVSGFSSFCESYKIIFVLQTIFVSCSFDYTTVVVIGKVGTPLTQFNHNSRVTVVTPTDHPKSVRNCCVIEVFGGVFVLWIGFQFSVGIRVFAIGLS